MIKKTVLVSGASGIVGYGILRSLLKNKEDYFYKVDVLQNGNVLYEQNSGI